MRQGISPYKVSRWLGACLLALAFIGASSGVFAREEPRGLQERVRRELATLAYYGVFDFIQFELRGSQVILRGHVTRPTLKDEAEVAVRDVEDVTAVSNQIEVLPLSPNDDRIREAAYLAIFGHPSLSRYAAPPTPTIRIIVEDGRLTLKGFVENEADKSVAEIQANSVTGVFSVENNLAVR